MTAMMVINDGGDDGCELVIMIVACIDDSKADHGDDYDDDNVRLCTGEPETCRSSSRFCLAGAGAKVEKSFSSSG